MSFEDNIRKVEPYVAGEQPKDTTVIKLNTNECPYPPAPGVIEAVNKCAKEYDRFRLYPDMDATLLVNALAEYYKVDKEQVFVGVGSDDVLAMSFLTYFTSGKKLLFPDITYSFYDVWAKLYRIPYEAIPLKEDFSLDPLDYIPGSKGGRMESAAREADENIGGIIFPNPNAPTGVELPLFEIEKIVSANPDKIIIIDEAYIDFGGTSALSLVDRYENLLVVQTFSKSRAMAGMRIGFAIGSSKLIKYLKDVKFSFNSYTMNMPSILIGTEAVKDDAYFKEITGRIVETREHFKAALTELGFIYPDSMTNFVFAKHTEVPAAELFAELRKKKIIVRYFNKPRINDYLRITIGTREQMDSVIEALHEILKK